MESLEKIKELIKDQPPEILRALLLQTVEDSQRLREIIKIAEQEKYEQRQQHLNIEEQIKLLKKKLFGKSKEKRTGKDEAEKKRDDQEDAFLFSQAAFPAPDESKSLNEKRQSLPEETIIHSLTSEELKSESILRGIECPSADQWEEITGAFDTVTTIQVIERSFLKEVHRKKKYKLKDEFNPDKDEKTIIITASGPSQLLPGMNYSTEFVANVVADKYVMHMPLERQVKEMKSLGLPGIRTSTLSRFCALAAASFEEMAENIKLELLNAGTSTALHLDETPWKIQNKNEKDGYMWVISNRLGSYYFYKPTRSGKEIKEHLSGYSGPVLTDGYAGYNILEELKIPQGYCWSHGRRNFLPLEKDDPGVKIILDDIDELFAIERKAKTFDELSLLREKQSSKIIERLLVKLQDERPRSRPKSLKRKAIDYLLSRWKGFTLFLKDIRLPLSNNEAERTIRHAVMGRKNYYGSNNHTGAETAATLFTIIESCKKNEIDSKSFILMSLKKIAAGESVMTPLEFAKNLRMPIENKAN